MVEIIIYMLYICKIFNIQEDMFTIYEVSFENKTKWSIAQALKWLIFIAQMASTPRNVVEFCQEFMDAIRLSLTTLYNIGQCHVAP